MSFFSDDLDIHMTLTYIQPLYLYDHDL